MKTLKLLFMTVGVVFSSLTFTSCLDDDGYSLGDMWLSIATARPYGDNSFYLTLDDSTSLWPGAPIYINYQPKQPQRVQINYTILGDNYDQFDHIIKINKIDTILTKAIAENMGSKNDSIYGTDPVEITSIWVGDGFLNIEFRTYFGYNVKHFVNLIPDESASENPYKLEFRHNAFNDQSSSLRYGFVAFDLSSLPDTEGKEVSLIIKALTFDGTKEFEKKYISGKNTEPEPKLNTENFENTI